MEKIKNIFSWFKKNAASTRTNFKSRSQKFKEKIEKAKNQPKSKWKSLILGFTTVLAIFGVTLILGFLAVAKETSRQLPKPNGVANQQALAKQEIVKVKADLAGSLCALAISSGSFVPRAVCGFVVDYGILKLIPGNGLSKAIGRK